MDEKKALVCEKTVYCGGMDTLADCEWFHRVYLHSEACLDAIIREDGCSWLDSSYIFDLCYPPCSGSYFNCSGSKLKMCFEGRKVTADCVAVCNEEGSSYLGCDDRTPDGDYVGSDTCWCSGWKNCTGDAFECLTSDIIRVCVNGNWEIYDCDWICQQGGDYDHSVGCWYDSDRRHDVCWCE